MSVYLFLQALSLWQLATISRTNPIQTAPMILSLFGVSIAAALLSWKLILPVPVDCFGVIAVCLWICVPNVSPKLGDLRFYSKGLGRADGVVCINNSFPAVSIWTVPVRHIDERRNEDVRSQTDSRKVCVVRAHF